MKKKLVIFGTSNFARIMHYWFTHDSDYEVVAFTVDREYLDEEVYQGLPVIPFEELETTCSPAECDVFVALGLQKLNQQRADKVAETKSKGYSLASYLSSQAIVAKDFEITPNSVVMDGSVIQPFVTIGENVIIWSTTRIAMQSHIGHHSWLVACLSGEQVTVGESTFIGLGAIIVPGVTIGRQSVIGAGALITGDLPEASVIRKRGDKPSKVPSTRLGRI